MTSIDERIQGGIYGLLVGGALGVPYEFHGAPISRLSIARSRWRPRPFSLGMHGSVPPGTWSDDGAQALALLASLLECGRLDVDDFGRRLVAWYERGYMAVDNRVFDVGIQTKPGHLGTTRRAGQPGLRPGRRAPTATAR